MSIGLRNAMLKVRTAVCGIHTRAFVMGRFDRITIKAGLCGGRPTIRGLRIRVQDVLDLLAHGAPREEILADYPYLEDADITSP